MVCKQQCGAGIVDALLIWGALRDHIWVESTQTSSEVVGATPYPWCTYNPSQQKYHTHGQRENF